MERAEFLRNAQIKGLVSYNDMVFIAKSYILSFDKVGKPLHKVELLDKNLNSIVICELEKVKEYNPRTEIEIEELKL